jgi:glutathione S-transferase
MSFGSFVGDRKEVPPYLSEFPNLVRWEDAIRALGHGTTTSVSAEDAIARTKGLEPIAESGVAPKNPQGLTVGASVTVHPDVYGGEQTVKG